MIILFCGAEAHNDELIREATARLRRFRLVDVADQHAAATGAAAHGSSAAHRFYAKRRQSRADRSRSFNK